MKRGSSHGDAIFEATHGIAPDKFFISKRGQTPETRSSPSPSRRG